MKNLNQRKASHPSELAKAELDNNILVRYECTARYWSSESRTAMVVRIKANDRNRNPIGKDWVISPPEYVELAHNRIIDIGLMCAMIVGYEMTTGEYARFN